jgi:two-component system, OmpR family, sensor histidine kinase CpxA
MHAHGRFIVHTDQPDRFWIGTRVALLGADFPHPVPGLLLAASDNIWQTSLLFDFKFAGLVFATVLILSIVFWWPFIFRITHDLSALTLATERIAEGKFDTRIKSKRPDEIGRLSEAVDSMAERLSNFVSGQKRFLGDISHELFSPLARLQLALELLKGSSTTEQQSLIDDLEEEACEMNNLINELLAFSKAGLKGKTPELVEVNLKSLIDTAASRLDKEQSIEIAVPATLMVLGDPLLLDRSISNVIRNSIRYAGDCGPISVAASRQGEEIVVVITDNGPGVPDAALKNLSEPFFRPERSRDRSSGGVGLGLAIVKTCVEACGGSLTLRNRHPHGFAVEIRLQSC